MPGTEYRPVLLEIASKWLELSDRDAATQALLDEVETTKRPAI